MNFSFDDYDPSRSGKCPYGHKCPTGSSYPVPCEVGQYQDELGQEFCKECDQYKYCSQIGLTAPEAFCARGYVCLGGASVAQPNDYFTGKPCDKGSYCLNGRQEKCPDGTYAPVQGMSECETCPPGSYCNDVDGTSEPQDCPTQHYCPAGTSDPIICPDGTYTEVY